MKHLSGSDTIANELDPWIVRFVKASDVHWTQYSKRDKVTKFTWDGNYTIYGICGASAGGDGGKGGHGGRAGTIKIFELNANSSIVPTVAEGGDGEPGIGGSKGRQPPIIHMNRFKEENRWEEGIVSGSNSTVDWTELSRQVDPDCPKLHDSEDGANVKGIQEPADLSKFPPAVPVNEFLAYIRENQTQSFRRVDLANLVQQIENSSAISSD